MFTSAVCVADPNGVNDFPLHSTRATPTLQSMFEGGRAEHCLDSDIPYLCFMSSAIREAEPDGGRKGGRKKRRSCRIRRYTGGSR